MRYGFGYGSGYGDGFGSGYGDGSGSGFGFGHGSGFGFGYGSGHGSGFGDGSGFGSGSGYGSGYGSPVGTVGEWEVEVLAPWPAVRIGCQAHTIDEWSDQWRDIARREGVAISETEADALLEKARLMAAGRGE